MSAGLIAALAVAEAFFLRGDLDRGPSALRAVPAR